MYWGGLEALINFTFVEIRMWKTYQYKIVASIQYMWPNK